MDFWDGLWVLGHRSVPYLLTFFKIVFVLRMLCAKKSDISKIFDEIQGLFGKKGYQPFSLAVIVQNQKFNRRII